MSVKIRNLTSRPLWLSLNSGATLRLSPGQASGEVSEVEVTKNAKLDKLLGRRIIAITPAETEPAAAAGEKKGVAKPPGRKRIELKTPARARGRAGAHAQAKTTAPAAKETATPAETEPAAAVGE